MAEKLDPNKKDKADSAQFQKQDTHEDILERVKELRDQIFDQIEGDDSTDPMIVERMNQIFNDAIVSIPPNPQEPKFQRATIASVMTRIKEQAVGALNSFNTGKENVADKFKGPFEEAEKKAIEEDKQKGTAQPGGPSQSQEQTRLKEQPEQLERQAGYSDQRDQR